VDFRHIAHSRRRLPDTASTKFTKAGKILLWQTSCGQVSGEILQAVRITGGHFQKIKIIVKKIY